MAIAEGVAYGGPLSVVLSVRQWNSSSGVDSDSSSRWDDDLSDSNVCGSTDGEGRRW